MSKYLLFYTLTLWLLISLPSYAGINPCLDAPTLPAPVGNIVSVNNEAQLQQAITNIQPNTTVLLSPGNYLLTMTLYIQVNDVTLRGDSDRCNAVNLIGPGMEQVNYGNVPHGIWTNASGLTVQNLTIRDVYFHPIQLSPEADAPHFYNLRLLDAGEQFIKGSSGGYAIGVDNGVVEYTIMQYTSTPPLTDHGGGTGYTNGVDIHGGDGWIIRHNLFKNFHTDDDSQNLWNPAILMWNGSRNTISDSNTFINVDRAIAYGLTDSRPGHDHFGGIIKNNVIVIEEGLFSQSRRSDSDGLIIVWDSPETQVLHNSILTNGNHNKSIEFRFNTDSAMCANNLSDAPIGARNGAEFTQSGNFSNANPSFFVNPEAGDLHLLSTAIDVIDQTNRIEESSRDIDGENRPNGPLVDIGADEWVDAEAIIFANGLEPF